jgi:hypothetical protein
LHGGSARCTALERFHALLGGSLALRVTLGVAAASSGGWRRGSVSFRAPSLVINNGARRGAAGGFEGLRRGGTGQRGGWQRCRLQLLPSRDARDKVVLVVLVRLGVEHKLAHCVGLLFGEVVAAAHLLMQLRLVIFVEVRWAWVAVVAWQRWGLRGLGRRRVGRQAQDVLLHRPG